MERAAPVETPAKLMGVGALKGSVERAVDWLVSCLRVAALMAWVATGVGVESAWAF